MQLIFIAFITVVTWLDNVFSPFKVQNNVTELTMSIVINIKMQKL
jgi:hypothetical protein